MIPYNDKIEIIYCSTEKALAAQLYICSYALLKIRVTLKLIYPHATLYIHTLSGGALEQDEIDGTEEFNALIGVVVAGLLEKNDAVTLQLLIEALYQVCMDCEDEKIMMQCLEAILTLKKTLH